MKKLFTSLTDKTITKLRHASAVHASAVIDAFRYQCLVRFIFWTLPLIQRVQEARRSATTVVHNDGLPGIPSAPSVELTPGQERYIEDFMLLNGIAGAKFLYRVYLSERSRANRAEQRLHQSETTSQVTPATSQITTPKITTPQITTGGEPHA